MAVTFSEGTDVPVEKFIFKLAVNQLYDSEVEDADLEFALRSFLIKLPASESLTKALSRGKHADLHCPLLIHPS